MPVAVNPEADRLPLSSDDDGDGVAAAPVPFNSIIVSYRLSNQTDGQIDTQPVALPLPVSLRWAISVPRV